MTKFFLSLVTAIALASTAACGSEADLNASKAGVGFSAKAREGAKNRKPDLVVTSVKHTPQTPIAGDEVNFQITVKNAGRAATPKDTIIGVGVFRGNGPSVAFSDTYKGSLAAGASMVLETNKPWSALEGANTLRVVVDDVNRISESNESNNEVPYAIAVAAAGPKLPDLIVSEFSHTPAHPEAGDIVTFTATVKNNGTASTAGGTVLGLGFQDQTGATIAFSDTHTDELAPGASVAITTNGKWIAVEGSHAITAIVDPMKRVDELDETNNTLAKSVVVNPPAVPLIPDLVVTDFTATPAAPKVGEVVTFSATVKNIGTGPTPAGTVLGVGFQNAVNVTVAFSDTHTASLAAGSSVQLKSNQPWTTTAEGTQNITAYVDDVNRVAESNEANNKLSKSLTVAPEIEPGLPDLTVVGYTVTPASPKEGDVVSFTTTVKNIGTAPTPQGVVLGVGFQNSQGSTVAYSATHTASLAAGATLELTTNKTWTAVQGTQTMTAYVDDVDRIPEGNEGNNKLAKTVTVASVSTPPAPSPTNAKPAFRFIDSIGVNTHFAFTGTNYGNSNYPKVRDRLLELGVKHIRDGSMNASGYKAGTRATQLWNELATHGVKMNMIARYNWTATDIIDVLNANRASIISIEGTNEPDLFIDAADWVTPARNFQRLLWNTVKGSSYAHLPVLSTSLAQPRRYPMLGDLSAWANYGNIHSYNGGRMPMVGMDYQYEMVNYVTGKMPLMSTETGYHHALNTSGGHVPISERGFAKYLPRLYFDYFNAGIVRTYQYQFYDHIAPSSSNAEANFGLVRYDYSVKQVFTNLKNTIAILKDSSASIPGGTLSYSLSGNTGNVRSTLLQKTDGKFYLVLWQDVSVWNTSSRTDINNADVGVTVTFPSTRSTALYKPSVSAAPISTRSGTSVTVNVPDEIVILEVN